jgi:hypothetical protein
MRLTGPLRWILVVGVVVLGGCCFLRYLGWAFAYSGTLGLRSRTHETQLAEYRSWFFLCAFAALEVVCAALLGSAWETPDLASAKLRFVARYGIALAASLIATGVVVALQLAFVR